MKSKTWLCKISLFIVLGPMTAYASGKEDCPTAKVDTTHLLKESHQASAERHERANSNICFSFAAAELMSFELKQTVLPYDVALKNFSRKQDLDKMVAESLNTPHRTVSIQQGGRIPEAMIFSSYPNLGNSSQQLCSAEGLTKQEDWQALSSLTAFIGTGEPDNTTCSEQNIKGLHKFNMTLKEIFSAPTPLSMLDKIVQQVCPGKKVDVKSIHKDIESKNFVFNATPSAIKDVLQQGKPVGIEFSTRMISPEMVARHAAILIGMEYDQSSGQCKFLLKDSYGKSCRPNLNADVTCDKKTGYYLVPEKLALEHVEFVSYFKSRKK